MRTLKYITLAILALTTITSCTTEEYYNDIYEENWHVKEFEVLDKHWKLIGRPDEIGSYYEYIFSGIPLDVSYYDGIVTAYMFFDFDSQNEVQTPLPYTEYFIDDATGVEYSVQYSYDVKADGTIAFKIYVSDYYTSLFTPGTEYFRIAIVW